MNAMAKLISHSQPPTLVMGLSKARWQLSYKVVLWIVAHQKYVQI